MKFLLLIIIFSSTVCAQQKSNPTRLEEEIHELILKLPEYTPDRNGIDIRVKDFTPAEAALAYLQFNAFVELYAPLSLRVHHHLDQWMEPLEFHSASHIFDSISSETFSYTNWVRSYLLVTPDPQLLAELEIEKIKSFAEIETIKMKLLREIFRGMKENRTVPEKIAAAKREFLKVAEQIPGNKVDARLKYLKKLATMPSQNQKLEDLKNEFEFEARFSMAMASTEDLINSQMARMFFIMLKNYFDTAVQESKYVFWVKFVPIVKRFNLRKMGKLTREHLGSVSREDINRSRDAKNKLFHIFSDGHSEFRFYYSKGEKFREQVFEMELPIHLLKAWRSLTESERGQAEKIVNSFLRKFKKLSPRALDRINDSFEVCKNQFPSIRKRVAETTKEWTPQFIKSQVDLTISKDLRIRGDQLWQAQGYNQWDSSFQKIFLKSSQFKLHIVNDTARSTLLMSHTDYSVGFFGQDLYNEYSYGWRGQNYKKEFSAFSWGKGSAVYIRDYENGPILSALVLPNTDWLEKFYAEAFDLKKPLY